MTKSSREMGEPWGVPTDTGAKVLGEPWKRRQHCLLVSKLPIQEVRYLWAPLALGDDVSWAGSMLSKPPLMSRKRKEDLRPKRWKTRTSWEREAVALKVDKPAREPVWLGWMRPRDLAKRARREATILSRTLDTVSRRTMTLKEAGLSLEDFPGLSNTTPLAFLRDAR